MSKSMIASKTKGARPEGNRKATEILKEDHGNVKDLFKQFRSLEDDDAEGKERLFGEIDQSLTVHAAVEEEIFYPAVKALDTEEPVDQVLEAREEHQIVKTLLGQLRELTPSDETFDAKMKVLMEAVEHHAEEEEDEMFSSAKKLGSEDLLRLGAVIEERKRSLEARGGMVAGQDPKASAKQRSARTARSR